MTFDYRIGDRILRVVYADITELQVDAIVSSDGTDLSMSGGVSASIAASAEASLGREVNKLRPLLPCPVA